MKKKILLALVVVSMLVCLFAITSSAATLYEGIYYDLNATTGTATVSANNRTDCTLKEMVIPATFDYDGVTYTVTALADRSIGHQDRNGGNNYVEYIYVPSTVTSFGSQIFRNCPNLKTLKIDASISSIAGHSIAGNGNLEELDLSGMTKLTKLEGYAAQGCSKLTTVKLPNSVTTIGDKAFQDCAVTNIVFPSCLESIGSNCFQNADFVKVVIPKSVATISSAAFHMTSALKTIVFAGTDLSGYTNSYFAPSATLIFYAGESADAVKTQFSQFASFATISYDTYLNEIKNDPNKIYTNTIVYGTSNCECGEVITGKSTFVHKDYLSGMYDAVVCSNCKAETIQNTYAPIMEFVGYSTKIDGDRICVGYTINSESLKVFTERTNKTLKFGVTATIVADGTTQYQTINSDLTAINDKTIVAQISSEYVGFDFILSGFKSNHYEKLLVMCAFAYDGSKIIYIDNGGCNEYATPFTFSSISK